LEHKTQGEDKKKTTKAQIDIISLSETLRINKSLEKVGDVAYLAELTDKGLSSKNVGFYVSLIILKNSVNNYSQEHNYYYDLY
jgi:replicative DNA helicase